MKKILIIAHHFPPFNVIASQRSSAFANYLSKSGFELTVLTHQWINNAGDWEIAKGKAPLTEEEDGYRIIRVALGTESWKKGSSSAMETFIHYSKGIFEVDEINLNAYTSLKSYLFSHLENESCDILLASYSPHHNVRLCFEAGAKFNIPYHLDFRDLWNHLLLKADYIPGLSEKTQNHFIRKYWGKWLANANSCTVISRVVGDYLDKFSKVKKVVLLNGFEENLFQGIERKPSNDFVICHCGSLYPFQDVSLFFKGVRLFLEKENCSELKIRFVGVKSEEMKGRIENELDSEALRNNVEIVPRIARREALQEMKNSNLLFFPGWTGIPGGYSGKIFEYIASGVPILLAPSDNDVVEKLIEDTQTGYVVPDNDVNEVSELINKVYQAWKKSEDLIEPINDEIQKYTREEQVGKLAREIKTNQ